MNKLNENAHEIAQKMIKASEYIDVTSSVSKSGATIIDAGINATGSIRAGILFSAVCLGGLADVDVKMLSIDNIEIPCAEISTPEPVRACMASQYAGWTIKGEGEDAAYFAMASGPARALYAREEIYQKIGCAEKSDVAVLALETRQYPPDSVIEYIAQSCGVEPKNLTLLLAPSASIVGSIQVAARIVETGIHKLFELGFDINTIKYGYGRVAIAPMAANDGLAIGWTNDGILYGGEVTLRADCDDDAITSILDKIPACASKDYGRPFFEILKSCNWDFYKIDPLLFSPAVVHMISQRTGNMFDTGIFNIKLLQEQWPHL